jgi:hypothetical protein
MNRLLALMAVAGGAALLAGCGSSTTAVMVTPSPSAAATPNTSPSANGVDAYWFNVTGAVAGGGNWTSTLVSTGDPATGIGDVRYSGPNGASIEFLMPAASAGSDPSLTAGIQAVVTAMKGKLTKRDAPLTLGGETAIVDIGTDSTGRDFYLIVGYHGGKFVSVTLLCMPADFVADQNVLNALVASFQYQH